MVPMLGWIMPEPFKIRFSPFTPFFQVVYNELLVVCIIKSLIFNILRLLIERLSNCSRNHQIRYSTFYQSKLSQEVCIITRNALPFLHPIQKIDRFKIHFWIFKQDFRVVLIDDLSVYRNPYLIHLRKVIMSFFGVSRSALEIRLRGLGYLIVRPRYCYHDPCEFSE